MDEQWLPIAGYEGYYEVSDLGRVRSLTRRIPHKRLGFKTYPGRIMRCRVADRYLMVKLCRDGVESHRYVHHLVLEAFSGMRPDGMHGCHRNDIRTDNRLTNLYWGSPSQNAHDKTLNGNCHNANKTRCVRGHEFTPQNTYLTVEGWRMCRACSRLAKLKEKTQCVNGHRYDEMNTIIGPDGSISCAECKRLAVERQKIRAEKIDHYRPNAQKTHCKRGHEFTLENTAIRANGRRDCRECHRVQERERQRRLKTG